MGSRPSGWWGPGRRGDPPAHGPRPAGRQRRAHPPPRPRTRPHARRTFAPDSHGPAARRTGPAPRPDPPGLSDRAAAAGSAAERVRVVVADGRATTRSWRWWGAARPPRGGDRRSRAAAAQRGRGGSGPRAGLASQPSCWPGAIGPPGPFNRAAATLPLAPGALRPRSEHRSRQWPHFSRLTRIRQFGKSWERSFTGGLHHPLTTREKMPVAVLVIVAIICSSACCSSLTARSRRQAGRSAARGAPAAVAATDAADVERRRRRAAAGQRGAYLPHAHHPRARAAPRGLSPVNGRSSCCPTRTLPGAGSPARPRSHAELRGADLILHAGDVCTAGVLDELAQYAPVTAVSATTTARRRRWGAAPDRRARRGRPAGGMIHDSGPAAGRLPRMRRAFPARRTCRFRSLAHPARRCRLRPADLQSRLADRPPPPAARHARPAAHRSPEHSPRPPSCP